ncbi:hypothetical protein DAPPUDRAFT_112337 [Daphnia pulex]|uniref:Uncharacterized protein n=1 Tax=Daphnia pulex TaxID=6669 RepID=E9HBQ9_DAPPU|nr:hypothetical protein DAPPUDRAFT_112337 [Daphnia pulex]|eukprot:EFX70830.1 hypothetical protein DAPPUDRAFT_112337 [Daphnia pulex]
MSIHNIAELVGLAFPLATTPANITSGFRVAGLVPFNRFIFDGDVDFAPSFVTDRPFNSSPVPPIDDFIEIPASNDNIVEEGQTPVPENHIEANVSTTILPDLDNIVVIFEEDSLATVENVNISLDVQNGETFDLRGVLEEDSNRNPVEIMRPYPKAGPRKGSSTGRKRSTAILTDTPVKAQLEKEKMATDAKKNKLGKVRRK